MSDFDELRGVAASERAQALLNANPPLALRVEAIEEERDVAWRAMDAAWGRVTEARSEVNRAKTLLAELEQFDQRGKLTVEHRGDFDEKGHREHTVSRDDARLRRASEAVAAAESKVQRATEAHASATDRWTAASNVSAACERYLSSLIRYEPVEHRGQPRRGESHADAVARVRADIARLAEEAVTVDRAPLPADETKRRIEAEVRRLAERSATVVDRDGSVRWPMAVDAGSVHGAIDTLGIMARLFPELLIAMAVDSAPQRSGAMTEADRTRRLTKIAETVLQLGRDEEALISDAAAHGIQIFRRGDADPRVVLGVDGPAPRGD